MRRAWWIVEGAQHGAVGQLLELLHFNVGERCAGMAGNIQASERADAIGAVGVAEGLVVGEFRVAVGLDGFADVLVEVGGVDASSMTFAGGVDETQRAVGELEAVVFIHHAEEGPREVGEVRRSSAKRVGDLLCTQVRASLMLA